MRLPCCFKLLIICKNGTMWLIFSSKSAILPLVLWPAWAQVVLLRK